MCGIIEKEERQMSVIIPAIPGLREEVEFNGINFNPIVTPILSDIKVVSAGVSHTLALLNNNIYGCGDNSRKQLLDVEDQTFFFFTLLPLGEIGDRQIISVKAGNRFSVALIESGEVFVWGRNDNNIFNIGEDQFIIPRLVRGLEGIRIVEIDCGHSHIIARSENGEVYTWGLNSGNSLGFGDYGIFPPTRMNVPQAVKICAKTYRSAMIDISGNVHVWGLTILNDIMQFETQANTISLGNEKLLFGSGTSLTTYYFNENITDTIDVESPIISIASGDDFYLIVFERDDGTNYIKANGNNQHGKLGSGDPSDYITSYDEHVDVLIGYVVMESISSGANHSIVMNTEGHLYSWGSGEFGCLGTGGDSDQYAPVEVYLP